MRGYLNRRKQSTHLYNKELSRRNQYYQEGEAINWGAIGSNLLKAGTSEIGQNVIGNLLGAPTQALGQLIASKINPQGNGLVLAGARQRGNGLVQAGRGKKKMMK